MNIIEAARAMGQGKAVKRPEWEFCAHMSQAYRMAIDENGDDVFFDIDDLTADDWEVVDEDN